MHNSNLMTRFLLTVLALYWSGVQVHAQYIAPPGSPGVSNFDSAAASFSDIMIFINAQIQTTDTLEGGRGARARSFEHFWGKRVVKNDTVAPNMFERYHRNLNREIALRRATAHCPEANIFGGKWICNGPDSLIDQNLAYVTDVWVDPANPNKIFVGTHGGLFKSFNGGATWACITDNSPVSNGVVDISTIAVRSTNKQHIVLGTSSEDIIVNAREWGGRTASTGDYGVGVLYTLDSGINWAQDFPPVDPLVNSWHDSIMAITRVYFSPNGDRLYVILSKQLWWCNWGSSGRSGSWYNATVPYKGVDLGLPDLVFKLNTNDTFYLTGNSMWMYKGTYNGTNHIWDSVRLPSLAYPGYTTRNDTDSVFVVPNYVNEQYEFCRIRIPKSYSIYVLLRFYPQLPPSFPPGVIPIAPKDLICRYHLDNGTWSVNNPDIPIAGLVGSGSCCNFAVSTADTSDMYYGNAIAQFSNSGGSTWNDISAYFGMPTHGDIRAILPYSFSSGYQDGTGDILYFATDGGLAMKPYLPKRFN